MEQLTLFINSFLSYLLLVLVIVVVGGIGLAIGIGIRKKKNAVIEEAVEVPVAESE